MSALAVLSEHCADCLVIVRSVRLICVSTYCVSESAQVVSIVERLTSLEADSRLAEVGGDKPKAYARGTPEPLLYDSTSGTIVKLAPSSGLAIGSPLITAAAEDCRAYVAAPPTSPCSPVLPGRRGGPPSGDLTAPPALSLRAEGTEALVPPPCTGETREENFPFQIIVVGDEGKLIFVAIAA